MQHFLWLARKQRLLTNSERVHRSMADDACYLCCGGTKKSVLHALFDCVLACQVWRKCLIDSAANDFFSLELDEWLTTNLKGKFGLGYGSRSDAILFTVLAWLIWKHRNMVVI